MRYLFPLLLTVAFLGSGGLAAQDPEPLPLPVAENQYLEAWDYREGNEAIPVPAVSPRDRPALRWLVAAAGQSLPANPFPAGSAGRREAEAVRRFLRSDPAQWPGALGGLPLSHGGSYLALWRWGQPKVRSGQLGTSLRQQWEDRLLEERAPAVIRDLAMRHAFCFALAESDAERFARLKERTEDQFPDLFPRFQNAFALLGAPAPVVHLWTLPGMESVDLPLSALDGTRVHILPDPGQGLPPIPPGTAWIVPTRDGTQPESSSYLEGPSLFEARQLIPRLEAADRKAFLAPARKTFETYALMYFPIRIDMDADGIIRSIRMGDAALAKP